MQSIILVGKPNVGKSSLFNKIAHARIAITSDIAGTTRDTNTREVNINSKKALLIDSGGLDESDELFRAVKQNTLTRAKHADIVLYMVDGKKNILMMRILGFLGKENGRKFGFCIVCPYFFQSL